MQFSCLLRAATSPTQSTVRMILRSTPTNPMDVHHRHETNEDRRKHEHRSRRHPFRSCPPLDPQPSGWHPIPPIPPPNKPPPRGRKSNNPPRTRARKAKARLSHQEHRVRADLLLLAVDLSLHPLCQHLPRTFLPLLSSHLSCLSLLLPRCLLLSLPLPSMSLRPFMTHQSIKAKIVMC